MEDFVLATISHTPSSQELCGVGAAKLRALARCREAPQGQGSSRWLGQWAGRAEDTTLETMGRFISSNGLNRPAT